MKALEVNFDGIVGPTHYYGGLSYGNTASMEHKGRISNPKKAALEGLKKMKLLMDLGVPQAVLPPQMRPSLYHLRALGFRGRDEEVLGQSGSETPRLLQAVSSASAMWAANGATAAPSVDTYDGRVHISIANLFSCFHRSLEAKERLQLFQRIFPDFVIHPPLLQGGGFGDEGAANHTRFCRLHEERGIHLFVYGRDMFEPATSRFPLRQTLQASQAIARRHGLSPQQTLFVQQNPELIDLGVFHNDMISTGHQNIFLYHEHAFKNTNEVCEKLKEMVEGICGCPFQRIEVTEEMLPIKEAIKTYLFNSQIVTLPDETIAMLAYDGCRSLSLDWLPFPVYFTDIEQSIQNGGGPACLRFRLVMTDEERKKVHPHLFLTEKLYIELVQWVESYYREKLHLRDLSDIALYRESLEALDRLTQLLHLPSFYPFQQQP